MFHPLSGLFESKKSLKWEKEDIKYFVQNYLRDELKTDGIVCQEVNGSTAVVAVTSPTLQQEVRLLEYDLKEAVEEGTGFEISEVKVVNG